MAAYRKSLHKSLLTIAGMAVLVGRWHSTQDPRMKAPSLMEGFLALCGTDYYRIGHAYS